MFSLYKLFSFVFFFFFYRNDNVLLSSFPFTNGNCLCGGGLLTVRVLVVTVKNDEVPCFGSQTPEIFNLKVTSIHTRLKA